jgi:hypothetical protein
MFTFMAAAASPAFAATAVTLNLSTGLDGSGVLQSVGGSADAHWLVDSQPAEVIASNNKDWWGGWPANDSTSDWIAKDPFSNSANGTGVYSRTFDLTGIDLNTIDFTGNWALDDEGTLAINGHQIGAYQPHDGWQNFATQTFDVTDATWFNPGENTLTLTIANADNFFEGVRLNGTITAATPEPASLAIAGVGIVALFIRRRR